MESNTRQKTVKKKISGNLLVRKYFWSWIPLIVTYYITTLSKTHFFFSFVIWFVSIGSFLISIQLKKVEYNSDFVFFNDKKVRFKEITNMYSFWGRHWNTYTIFITRSENILDKYHITRLGGEFALSKIIPFFFKALVSKNKNIELPAVFEFMILLQNNSDLKLRYKLKKTNKTSSFNPDYFNKIVIESNEKNLD